MVSRFDYEQAHFVQQFACNLKLRSYMLKCFFLTGTSCLLTGNTKPKQFVKKEYLLCFAKVTQYLKKKKDTKV